MIKQSRLNGLVQEQIAAISPSSSDNPEINARCAHQAAPVLPVLSKIGARACVCVCVCVSYSSLNSNFILSIVIDIGQ